MTWNDEAKVESAMQVEVRTRIASSAWDLYLFPTDMPDSRCSVGVAARLEQYDGGHWWSVVVDCTLCRVGRMKSSDSGAYDSMPDHG